MPTLARPSYHLGPSSCAFTFASFHNVRGCTQHLRGTTKQLTSRFIVGHVHSTASTQEDRETTTLISEREPIYEQMKRDVEYRPVISPEQYLLTVAISAGLIYIPLLKNQQLTNQDWPRLSLIVSAFIILFLTFRQLFLETFYTVIHLITSASLHGVYVSQLLQRREEQLKDFDSLFRVVDDIRVHYKCKRSEDKKSNMGLQLYHGFGSSLFSWKDVQPELANRVDACVTATDLLGFGLTQRPFFWGLYSRERDGILGRDILRYEMRKVPRDVTREVLVGNSLGGATAIEETIRDPQNIKAVILISPFLQLLGDPSEATSQKWPDRIFDALGHLFLARGARLLLSTLIWFLQPVVFLFIRFATRKEWFWEFGLSFVYFKKKEMITNVLDWYRFPLLARGWEFGIIRLSRATISSITGGRTVVDILKDRRNSAIDQFVQIVEEYDIQVLLIHGENDKLVPVASSEQLHRRLPKNSKFIPYPKCGHAAHEEYPERFIEDTTSFLRRLTQESPEST